MSGSEVRSLRRRSARRLSVAGSSAQQTASVLDTIIELGIAAGRLAHLANALQASPERARGSPRSRVPSLSLLLR
jgi:hypothetical protein